MSQSHKNKSPLAEVGDIRQGGMLILLMKTLLVPLEPSFVCIF